LKCRKGNLKLIYSWYIDMNNFASKSLWTEPQNYPSIRSYLNFLNLLIFFLFSKLLRPTLCENCCFPCVSVCVGLLYLQMCIFIYIFLYLLLRLSGSVLEYMCLCARWSAPAAETFKFKYKCCTCPRRCFCTNLLTWHIYIYIYIYILRSTRVCWPV